MTAARFDRHGDKLKFIIIAASLAISTFLAFWFHIAHIAEPHTIYTHFFYVQIIMASFWWQKRGMYVALYLSVLQLLVHFMFHGQGGTADNLVRVSTFMFVSFITATLSEGLAKRQAALREREARYRRLFEAAKDGILILDAETGMILDANPFLSELLGYSHEELVGKAIWDIRFEEDRALSKKRFLELRQREFMRYEDLPLKAANGQKIDAEFVSNVYMDGNIKVVQCNIRDITEREKLEEALAKSETRFRNLVETTSYWVWEVDKSGVYTYASPAVRYLLGYEPEDVIGKTPFDLMPADEAKRVTEIFASLVSERKPMNYLELINLHKDGRHVILETCAVPFFDPDGILIGYRGVDRDITERKKLEDQLCQAQKMETVGQLAGGIAHDFNNILSAIIGYGHAALMKMAKDDPLRLNIEQMLAASDRAAQLTHSILAFSRK